MPNTREKLIELLSQVQYQGNAVHRYHDKYIQNGELADHLISNGVTVQDNTGISDELLEQLKNAPVTISREEPTIEVVQEWISVKDRLPDWRDGKVLVFTKYGFSICERTVNNRWQGQHANWITHWQYLPQPPRGE